MIHTLSLKQSLFLFFSFLKPSVVLLAFFTCPPERGRRVYFLLFLTLSLSLGTFHSFSQGIAINPTGAAADALAVLDVSSTNRGLRIPRVALTDTASPSPVTNPVNSLLVFDTVTFTGGIPGFYYWDATHTQWVRLVTGIDANAYLTTSAVAEVSDEFTATIAQTAFTLSQTPAANSSVKMYINGIRILKNAYGNTGTALTYVPASNGSYVLAVGDRINFEYYK